MLDTLEGGLSWLTGCVADDRAMLAVTVHAQWDFDELLTPMGVSKRYQVIGFLHLMLLKLLVQVPLRSRFSGKNHHTAVPCIQAVHNPQLAVFGCQSMIDTGSIWKGSVRDVQHAGGF